MAYIDFYRKDKQYRLVLGSFNVNNLIYRTTSNGFRNYDYDTIEPTQSGVELSQLFKIENLDWNNPDFITNDSNKYPCFEYTNKDNTLYLTIAKYKVLEQNIKGMVQTPTTVLEPIYTYNGTRYAIALSYSRNSRLDMTLGMFFYLPVAVSNETPNASKSDAGAMDNQCYLLMKTIMVEDKEWYLFAFADLTQKIPTQFLYATMASTQGTETKGYLRGCLFKNGPISLRLKLNGMLIYTQKTGWTNSFLQEIYGNNTIIDTICTVVKGFQPTLRAMTGYIDDSSQPQYPDQPQNPDDNDDTEGGNGDGDKTTDDITPDIINPTYIPTGLMTIYELQQNTLTELGKKLWSENIFTNFLKITGNPIDSIIGLYVSYINFQDSDSKSIMLGNVDTQIIAPVINEVIKTVDCGTININEFWGDFKDYNPFTKIQIFLPYIGVMDLNVNEIMHSTLNLIYRFNLLTNTCVALISISKTIDETNLNSVLYQFDGSFLDEIPISAASNNTKISARLSQMQQVSNGILRIAGAPQDTNGFTKANIGINAGFNIMQSEISAHHLDVARTGALKGSAGIIGISEPYIIIERCMPNYPSSYAKNIAVPTDKTITFNSLTGFTQILQVFINNFTGTQNEYNELLTLLYEGVVF